MYDLYFDLATEIDTEVDISDLILTRIKEYQSQQGLIKRSNLIKGFDS